MTNFIYSVTLLHFMVFIKKAFYNSFKTSFLFLPTFTKKCVHSRLIKIIQQHRSAECTNFLTMCCFLLIMFFYLDVLFAHQNSCHNLKEQ